MRKKTFVEKMEELIEQAIKRYNKLIDMGVVIKGDKMIDEEVLRSMNILAALAIVDKNEEEYAKRNKSVRCSTCVHLKTSTIGVKLGYVLNPLYQCCDQYVNPLWKRKHEQKIYYRRPSNIACPNYVYGEDNCFKKRKEEEEERVRSANMIYKTGKMRPLKDYKGTKS